MMCCRIYSCTSIKLNSLQRQARNTATNSKTMKNDAGPRAQAIKMVWSKPVLKPKLAATAAKTIPTSKSFRNLMSHCDVPRFRACLGLLSAHFRLPKSISNRHQDATKRT